jgi:hypothetical protein
LIYAILGLAMALSAGAESARIPATVYVTHAGKWYHRQGCYYLSKEPTAISLEEAKARGLRPCKFCRPDRRDIRKGAVKATAP